jgi:hypothetical protein
MHDFAHRSGGLIESHASGCFQRVRPIGRFAETHGFGRSGSFRRCSWCVVDSQAAERRLESACCVDVRWVEIDRRARGSRIGSDDDVGVLLVATARGRRVERALDASAQWRPRARVVARDGVGRCDENVGVVDRWAHGGTA